MIPELLLEVISLLLQALDALIPDVPMPFTSEFEDFAVFVGANLGGLNNFLPIEEIAVGVAWALTVYLPFVIGYTVARWVWSHLPYVGGS